MTTYSGKSLSYASSKEVVNKEPPVSKYVVEKLYRVHRERILKVEPTIDSHVHIPDFLKNQTWKKEAAKNKEILRLKHNQTIFDRISKAERAESQISKDTRVHIQRVNSKANYMKKLKEENRVRQVIRIQKENEYVLKRIELAKPQYSIKNLQDWYKHHELFKAGRRSDPTAGHIMHNMKGLLPASLPPLAQDLSSVDKSAMFSINASVQKNSMKSLTLSALDVSSSNVHSTKSRKQFKQLDRITQSANNSASDMLSTDLNSDSRFVGRSSSNFNSMDVNVDSRDDMKDLDAIFNMKTHSTSPSSLRKSYEANAGSKEQSDYYYDEPSNANVTELDFEGSREGEEDMEGKRTSYDQANGNDDMNDNISLITMTTDMREKEELVLIASRPFTITFETKNCMVRVYTSKAYDENLHFKAYSAGISPVLLSERLLAIDKAHEIVTAAANSGHLMYTSETEDVNTLSSMLFDMFKAADKDNSGSLTFDEFERLMEKVDLGISPQELRFVISEADENDNGLVDYNEFVPLAIDLIQSFRARNQAKNFNNEQDLMVDDMILRAISAVELEELTNLCLQKIREVDVKNYGLIRVPDLKKCLIQVSSFAQLRESEVSMLCKMLPRDQFGRIKYNSTQMSFYEVLSKVRFMTMKNAILESRGSGLQKYLLDICKEEEYKLSSEKERNKGDKFVPTGIIPCRVLINLLTSSKRLSLSRLQVLVIMSEAVILDGMIDYYQFIPVVAKAIELMFEPRALRQRAELIEKTDLSPEALLKGMSSEMFEQRLLTLFKSYDIDHSGGLDQNEFIACLESLELELTFGEMVALMASADINHTGFLQFEDFVSFFTRNLLNLEREKHIRLLQSTMLHHSTSGDDEVEEKERETKFITELNSIFQLSDPNNTGFLNYAEFANLLNGFHSELSKFLVDVMLSELNITDDGLVDYKKAVATCADLLKVFSAKETVREEERRREAWAGMKSKEIVDHAIEDINHIVRYLKQRIKAINENIPDQDRRVRKIQALLRNPHNGLARSESNILVSKLLTPMRTNESSTPSGLTQSSGTGLYAGNLQLVISATAPSPVAGNHHANTPSHGTPSHHVAGTPSHGSPSHQPAVSPSKFRHSSFSIDTMKNLALEKQQLQSGSHHGTPASRRHFDPTFFTHHEGNNNGAIDNATAANAIDNYVKSGNKFSTDELDPSAHSELAHNTPSSIAHQNNHVIRGGKGKVFRTNFTHEEIYEAVYEARRLSIMRGLLEDIDHPTLLAKITKLLTEELSRVKSDDLKLYRDDVEEDGQVFLPVKACFAALEHAHDLRLNRPQIMFILSISECFSRDGKALELHKFAEHGSNIISRMHLPENLETRAEVLKQGTIHVNNLMNGLKEVDLIHYLQSQFENINLQEGRMSQDDFYSVIKNIPRINLSDKETMAIVCGYVGHGHSMKWKDMVPSTVSSIQALCRERMIHRRVSLLMTSRSTTQSVYSREASRVQNESQNQLKLLAERLLNLIDVRYEGDALLIQFPIIENEKNKMSLANLMEDPEHHRPAITTNLLIKTGKLMTFVTYPNTNSGSRPNSRESFHRPSVLVSSGTVHSASFHTMSTSSSNINLTGSVKLPRMGTLESLKEDPNDHGRSSSHLMRGSVLITSGVNPSHMTKPVHNYSEPIQSTVPVFLKLLAQEDTHTNSVTLIVNVVTMDLSQNMKNPLNIRLPSVALVDREAAEQFAFNIVDQIIVEIRNDLPMIVLMDKSK